MARNRKNTRRGKASNGGGFNRMRARTEKMKTGVRLAFCGLALTACSAFLVAALKPYRDLGDMRKDLSDVVDQETAVIERKDAKERELHAIETDPSYLEIIARDRLNYYKPGEHVFRIKR
ncbi:MAG: septum formation initiator family protein [Akkermansiaceae bacterium]